MALVRAPIGSSPRQPPASKIRHGTRSHRIPPRIAPGRPATTPAVGAGLPLKVPYGYGNFVWMKKTLHIDQALLQEAKVACGAKSDTETVRLGLEALLRHAAYERLRALRGSEPLAREVP